MPRDTADEQVAESACTRCGRGLTAKHWVRLVASHRGTLADRYRDAERRVCVDCLAALGMLEIETEAPTEDETGGRLRDRFDPIRSLGR